MSNAFSEMPRVLNEGGWRLFMRESATELARGLIAHAAPADTEPCMLRIARAFVLAKHGNPVKARATIDGVSRQLQAGVAADRQVLNDLTLVDAHVRVYEDRPLSPSDAKGLQKTLETLAPDDQVGQALALNQLCILELHMGNFDKAQEHAEAATRLYRLGGGEYGSLHMMTHLGQIKLMRGDIEGSEAQYQDLEFRLSRLPGNTEGLRAISCALRSEVAYEMNALGRAEALLRDAMQSVEEQDAWLDVRAAAYRVRTRLAFVRSGLPGALTELSHCQRVAEERSMPRLAHLMQVERMRALTLSNEMDAALGVMRSLGLRPERYDWEAGDNWALRQGTTAVAIARWLVRSRRAHDALAFVEPAEDFAIRGGQLLSLAKLRVVKAAAHWRLNQKSDATGALLSALRLLGQQPFRRFILDEGQDVSRIVQAALDGDHVSVSPSLVQRRRLAELSRSWVLESGGSPQDRVGEENGGAREETARQYLELLAVGLSNKEIGRTMGVSVNTVKYHLKRVFSDLKVENRTRAVAEAQRLGIISVGGRD